MKGFSDLLHLGDVLVRQDEPETRARSEAGDAQLKPALHRWAMTRIAEAKIFALAAHNGGDSVRHLNRHYQIQLDPSDG